MSNAQKGSNYGGGGGGAQQGASFIAPGIGGNGQVTIEEVICPLIANAGPDQAICSSLTTTLAATQVLNANGNWSVISGPSKAATQFSDIHKYNATFTAELVGIYYLKWEVFNETCGVNTAGVTLTFSKNPIITSDYGFMSCVSKGVFLKESGIINTNNRWTSSNEGVATVGLVNGVTHGVSAGTTTITCTNDVGCSSSVLYTVLPSPTFTLTSTSPVCEGASFEISATGLSQTDTFVWSGPNNFSSDGTEVLSEAKLSYINAAYVAFGTEASLFDGVDNTAGDSFHADRLIANKDWGIAYTFDNSILITDLGIDRRNNTCCITRGNGGVMQVWKNGLKVYESEVLTADGDGIIYANPAPNVLGNEVRYIFLNSNNDGKAGAGTYRLNFFCSKCK